MHGTYSWGIVRQIWFLWDDQETDKHSSWMVAFKGMLVILKR